MRRPRDCSTHHMLVLAGLMLLSLLGWIPAAHADSVICSGPGAMALPGFGSVYVAPSAPAGTTFGPVVRTTVTFTCNKFDGATSVALTASISPADTYKFDNPTAGVITFQTNLAGVAVQLTPSNPGTAGHVNNTFPAGTITAPTFQTAQTYSAQLVKTTSGAVAAGTLNNIILIDSYSMTTNGGSGSLTNSSSLTLGSGTIKSGGCDTLNATATLPVVFASLLTGQGAVSGKTPVQLDLTDCPAGAQISISFAGTAATIAGTTSTNVLASSGTARNVDVQLLDNGNQPVDITGSVTASLGTASSSGSLDVTYYAQYYAIGPAGPGTVNAVATYTLTYQ